MKYRVKGVLHHLSHDFSYKTVALAVALVLWVTMLGRKDITVAKKLEVQFLNESSYEVVSEKDNQIEVEVVGPRMALKKFGQTEQIYTLDLTGLKAGTHRVRLSREGIVVPVGVKVIGIRPDKLSVTLVPVSESEREE